MTDVTMTDEGDGKGLPENVRLAYENTFVWTVRAEKPIAPLFCWTSYKTREFPFELTDFGSPAKLIITLTQVMNQFFNLKLEVDLRSDDPIEVLREGGGGWTNSKKIRLWLNSNLEIEHMHGNHSLVQDQVDPSKMGYNREMDLINTFDKIQGIDWQEKGCILELNIKATIKLYSFALLEGPKKKLRNSWINLKTCDSNDAVYVTIISKDGKNFHSDKRCLIGRSPVLRSMLTGEMEEATTGVIRMDDISSKTVKFILHYFHTGELLPLSFKEEDNSEKPCISEIIYVSDKYLLRELFEYFDEILVHLCNSENLFYFIQLTNLYNMKRAKGEIEKFVKANLRT